MFCFICLDIWQGICYVYLERNGCQNRMGCRAMTDGKVRRNVAGKQKKLYHMRKGVTVMRQQLLHKNWQMSPLGKEDWIPAKVPGTVYGDLLANGRMEDPYYRDNEEKALKIMEEDFEYVTHFDVPEEFLEEDIQLLHFDGIDTIADLYLNGRFLAHTENMHREFEYPVGEFLKEKNNELRVILYSPTEYIRKAYQEKELEGSSDAMRGFPYLRKAHCMFGWDWGPRLPDAGLWRSVRLLAFSGARFDSVYITQKHSEGLVELELQMDLELTEDGSIRRMTPQGAVRIVNGKPIQSRYGVSDKEKDAAAAYFWTVTVTDPDGTVRTENGSPQTIKIQNPRLWWPNGYGEQPLYRIRAELYRKNYNGDCLLDVWEKRIGLRTMTIHREKDEWGEQFAHEVNGVRIFAMGGDYIPEDNLLGRINDVRTRELLQQAADAHFNCIRVWGGGHYPHDGFYDACDELGLIVWQDFMFACAVYDLTPEFEENITREFIDNIRRIRHHASLGLWCGNNEMEQFVKEGQWVTHPKQKSDYVKMYEYILPKVLETYDPNTFYWPASPSSGGAFDDPNGENRGDVHYWDVWHGNKPITEYRKFYFRYLSEFGFQSFPSLKTCETFTEPEDRNIFSYVMEKHQRNQTANGKIMNYMEQTFLYPTSFDTVLYASQLLQAEAIRYGVEHFRRNRGRCMGTVIWQLNDCWPVASWSSIDYCGRWKALHYSAKRFFAPLLLSCEEEGILTQDTNPNAEPYPVRKSIRLNVSNESLEERRVTVHYALRNASAELIRQGETEVTVPALSAVWLPKEGMQDAELYSNYVSYELEENGTIQSAGTVLFCAPKHFRFRNPELEVHAEGNELVITAKAYAKSVEIINENDDMLLEDNYFDMNAGERRIRILKGKPEGLKIRSVYDIR